MPPAPPPGRPPAVAARTGPIHDFADDPAALARFLAADDGSPVPVVVRSLADDRFVARGTTSARSIQAGTLTATVEWPAEVEARVGPDAEPTARCEFDAAGRLVRVVVELDDDEGGWTGEASPLGLGGRDDEPGDDDPDSSPDQPPGDPAPHAHACGCDSPGSCTCHEPESHPHLPPAPPRDGADAGQSPDGPTPVMGHGRPQPDPEPEDAIMASRDQHDATDAPEMGADAADANVTANPKDRAKVAPIQALTVEELREQLQAERAEKERIKQSLKKTSDEDARKRRRLEELEAAEEDRKAAQLTEAQKIERAKADAERRAQEAEVRAQDAARQLTEVHLERLVEAEARKYAGGGADGFTAPELACKLIDRSRVEFDPESGHWSGVKDAVDALAKAYPSLLRQKRPGPGSPPRDEHPGNPARRLARNGGGNGTNGNGATAARSADDADPFLAFAQDRISYDPM